MKRRKIRRVKCLFRYWRRGMAREKWDDFIKSKYWIEQENCISVSLMPDAYNWVMEKNMKRIPTPLRPRFHFFLTWRTQFLKSISLASSITLWLKWNCQTQSLSSMKLGCSWNFVMITWSRLWRLAINDLGVRPSGRSGGIWIVQPSSHWTREVGSSAHCDPDPVDVPSCKW